MIKAFATFVASETGLVIGTTLFTGHRHPDAPDDCTVILERGPEVVDPERPFLRQKMFQVVTRGSNYHSAREQAHTIFDALIGRASLQITGAWIHSITGGAPQFLAQSHKGFEFSTNLLVRAAKEV